MFIEPIVIVGPDKSKTFRLLVVIRSSNKALVFTNVLFRQSISFVGFYFTHAENVFTYTLITKIPLLKK